SGPTRSISARSSDVRAFAPPAPDSALNDASSSATPSAEPPLCPARTSTSRNQSPESPWLRQMRLSSASSMPCARTSSPNAAPPTLNGGDDDVDDDDDDDEGDDDEGEDE